MDGRQGFERWLVIPIAAVAFIIAGALAGEVTADAGWRARVWNAGLIVTGVPLAWRTLRNAFAGHLAADLVAALAVLAALALGEPLAGIIVVLMQTGGEALERYAEGRASNAVRALEEAAPHIAHRLEAGRVEDVAASAIVAGDVLLVRPGELVPCDAEVIEGRSSVDASKLTGESVPVSAAPGTRIMSGSLNQNGSLTVRALAKASESQYERIVQLVRTAQASKSPLQRLADRYAVWFTPFTLLVCAVTFALTRDWIRVLSVLVVATPCPLILATPIAVIGGINRAARRQIIVRSGGALERLGSTTTIVFDKTGTLTIGRPQVSRVTPSGETDERTLLRLAGAVERHAGHALARTLVEAAERSAAPLPAATDVTEYPGRGVEGVVDGHIVTVGARSLVVERQPAAAAAIARQAEARHGLRAFVAIDGRAAGVVEYADELREGVPALLSELRSLGIERQLLLSGDSAVSVRAVAQATGITEAWGDLLPDGKLRFVRDAVADGERVLMVGDGTNDAPALSAATVGIALAEHGGGITAEAADIVVLNDDLWRVVDAVRISRRTLRIARQSIWVGLGLSAAAMGFAAFGYIPPTLGALLQEAIDIAVIVNALRTSFGGATFEGAEEGRDRASGVRPLSEGCQTSCQELGTATT